MRQRARARSAVLLAALLLSFLLSEVVHGGRAEAAPEPAPTDCGVPTVVVNAPVSASATDLIAQAGMLVSQGDLAAAEQLYTAALNATPPDPLAGQGLAAVQSRRLAAANCVAAGQGRKAGGDKAGADADFQAALKLDTGNKAAREALQPAPPTSGTAASRAAKSWDTFYADWVDPVVRLLLPVLAVLITLLVLTRLVTPVAVPPAAPAWPGPLRALVWWVGLAMVVGTAVVGTPLLVRESTGRLGGGHWVLPVVALALALAVVVLVLARGWEQLPLVLTAIAAATVVDVALAVRSARVFNWPFWPLLAAAAALGIVLMAAGRGHALRLAVRVTKSGQADAAATSYVLARLQDLGSSPPKGLKAPQQVDVNDLPAASLSALPVGRVASVISNAIGLLQPSVPWRATVDMGEDAGLVVALTRNGSTARTARVDAATFRLPPPTAPADGQAPADQMAALLVGAAAVVLTELAQRHRELRPGLCGATGWDSVAAHVIATSPPVLTDADAAVRQGLLAFAVNRDPGNALAFAAYLNELIQDDDESLQARRLDGLYEDVETRYRNAPARLRDGYLPLRLRNAHAVTAAWVNVCIAQFFATEARVASWKKAAQRYEELLARLAEVAPDRELAGFATGIGQAAVTLYDALVVLDPASGTPLTEPPDLEELRKEPASLFVHYDRACTYAVMAGVLGGPSIARDRMLDNALSELALLGGDERRRKLAREDPAFRALRENTVDDEDRWRNFWSLVEDDAPAFTDLPAFGSKGSALRDIGITSPADLLVAVPYPFSADGLAKLLSVPVTVVLRWRALAELARPRAGSTTWLDGQWIALLLDVGIASRHELRRRAAAAGFQEELERAAGKRGTRPLSDEEFRDLVAL